MGIFKLITWPIWECECVEDGQKFRASRLRVFWRKGLECKGFLGRVRLRV